MSYCLNPSCQKPKNPPTAKYCHSCGERLLLGERYRPLKVLAQGGFGKTFLAKDEAKPSQPHCAIKQFLPQGENRKHIQTAVRLFHQEALRLDELGKHPQIPELLAYIVNGDRQYLVQEFIAGEHLAAELETKGCFNEAQLRHFLAEFLPLLEFIHSQHVIHRDIKPENIIRRPDGKLVLVDFGAARFATKTVLGKTGTVVGSVRYVSPEQAIGKAVFASDIYSLGVTCIYLLTKIDPLELFDTGIGDWMWRKYLVTNPISDALAQIINRMLEIGTQKRYQSPREILIDLSSSPETKQNPIIFPIFPLLGYPQCCCESLRQTEVETLSGHDGWVQTLAFSPDGQKLGSGSTDGTIKVWEAATGEVLQTIKGHSQAIRTIVWVPQTNAIATGSLDRTIKVWETDTAQALSTIKAHADGICALAINANVKPQIGAVLASGSKDSAIKLWQTDTNQQIYTLNGHSRAVTSLVFTPDGKHLISGGDDRTIKLWQVTTGKLVHTFSQKIGWINHLAISPNGEILACATDDKTIKLWQLTDGKLIQTLISPSCALYAVAFSPDGSNLAAAGDDKTIRVWRVNTGELVNSLTGHTSSILTLAFHPSGKMLASGSSDRTIKLWTGN
ncbi:serine/threonine-protein kinase [Merismopedia glauca]|uniref:Serine/threonine protein kinase n=1 Tax=Merismopedia glauca CCAP 1448/3 TaxID=1296344 RepID=A0A2T1C0W4_9CYAN|nr:serine/threonine-protein kinase [Merismopedia glauca]PSB01818.1 serine/threonine protein kinase [Merismopedia glauca CCAP 1448/3]